MSRWQITGRALAAAAVLVLCAGTVMADEIKWTYVEAGYLGVNPDNIGDTTIDGSGDNFYLGGSFGFKNFHVIGQYADGTFASDIDRTDWRLGIGWHGLLGEKADLLGEVYYNDTEYKGTGSAIIPAGDDVSDGSYRADVGVRWRPIGLFEANGFVNYYDSDNYEDNRTSYEVRAIFHIWRVGIGASYEKFSDWDQYNGFVRFHFR